MATPLKIKDGSGNIQEMTTSDENYIAYQVGLHLAASDSAGDYGGINTDNSFTSVGTFTNTFFNEPVGTAPSTSITSGSTTSTIYQNQNQNAVETDSDTLSPLMWVDSGGQTGFKQMPDLDLNEAVDRYLTTIFTNDYPGSYRLASSAPSGDYSVHLSNVFTDTRTDGTSVAYNIYQRDTMTAPTTSRPMFVEDSAGGSGLKIRAMNDRQIKYSFGQRAKNRIGGSKIGSYQLRSSAQGAPTDPGTWVARGTADDTKQTTADVSYSRSFEANYEANYVKGYSTDYSNSFSRLYTGGIQVDYLRRFDGAYSTLTAIGQSYVNDQQYSSVFIANYHAPYTIKFDTAIPPNSGYESVGVNYSRAAITFEVINLYKGFLGSGNLIYATLETPYVPDFASYGNSYTGQYARFDSLYDGLKVQYTREFILYDSGADYSALGPAVLYQSSFFALQYDIAYTGLRDYSRRFSDNQYGDSVTYTSGQPYAQYYVRENGQQIFGLNQYSVDVGVSYSSLADYTTNYGNLAYYTSAPAHRIFGPDYLGIYENRYVQYYIGSYAIYYQTGQLVQFVNVYDKVDFYQGDVIAYESAGGNYTGSAGGNYTGGSYIISGLESYVTGIYTGDINSYTSTTARYNITENAGNAYYEAPGSIEYVRFFWGGYLGTLGPGYSTSFQGTASFAPQASYTSGSSYTRGYLSVYGTRLYDGYLTPAYGLEAVFYNGYDIDIGFGGYYLNIDAYQVFYSSGDDGAAQLYQRDGVGTVYIGTYDSSYNLLYGNTYEGSLYSGSPNYYTADGPRYTGAYGGTKPYEKAYAKTYQATYEGIGTLYYSVAGTTYDGGAAKYAGYSTVLNFLTARQYTPGALYLPGGTQIVDTGVSQPDRGYVAGGYTGTRTGYATVFGEGRPMYASVPSYNLEYTNSLTFDTYVRFIQYNKEYVPLGFNDSYIGPLGSYQITEFYQSDASRTEYYVSGPAGDSYDLITRLYWKTLRPYARGYSGNVYGGFGVNEYTGDGASYTSGLTVQYAVFGGYDARLLDYEGGTYSHFIVYGNPLVTYGPDVTYGGGYYNNDLDQDGYLSNGYVNSFDNQYIGPGGYETSKGYIRNRTEPYGLTTYVGGDETITEAYARGLGYTRRYITNANYTNAYDPTYQFPLQFYAAYTQIDGPFYDTPDVFTIAATYLGPSYSLSYDTDPDYQRAFTINTYSGSAYVDAFGGLGYLQDFSGPAYTGAPIGYIRNYLAAPPYYLVDYVGPGTQYYAGPNPAQVQYYIAPNTQAYEGVGTTSYVLTGDVQTYLGTPSFIEYYTGFGAYVGTYAGAYVKDILYTRTPTYLGGYTSVSGFAYYVAPPNFYTAGPYTGTNNVIYNTGYYNAEYEGGAPGNYILAAYAGGNYLGPANISYVRAYSITGAAAYYTGGYARVTTFYAGSGRSTSYLRAYLNTGATVYYSGGNYQRSVPDQATYVRNYTQNYTGDLSYYIRSFIGYYTRAEPAYYGGNQYASLTESIYTGPTATVYNRNYTEGPYVGPTANYTSSYSPGVTSYGTTGDYQNVIYTGGGYTRVGALYSGTLGTLYGEGSAYTGPDIYIRDYNQYYEAPFPLLNPEYTADPVYAGVQYLGVLDVAPELYVGPIRSYIPLTFQPNYIPNYETTLVGEVYYDTAAFKYAGPQADAPVAYGLVASYSRLLTSYVSDLYTGFLTAGQYILSYTGTTYTGVYSDITPAQNYTGAAFTTQYVRGDLGAQTYVGSYTGASLFAAQQFVDNRPLPENENRLYGVVYAGPEAVFTSQYEPGEVYSRRFSPNDYTGEFGSIENTFVGGFSTLYTKNYSRLYSVEFVESYQNDYSTIYTTTYESTYLTDYLNEYTASFEGETIEATDEVIETYTLYVRIA